MRSAYYHSSFRKQHKKLEKGIQRRFVERLELFLLNPFNQVLHNHKLHDKWLGYWGINVTGDYRAVYRLDGEVAIFVAIGTHSELYE